MANGYIKPKKAKRRLAIRIAQYERWVKVLKASPSHEYIEGVFKRPGSFRKGA